MKLLVVEDEALLRHHLQTRLTDSGHVSSPWPMPKRRCTRPSSSTMTWR